MLRMLVVGSHHSTRLLGACVALALSISGLSCSSLSSCDTSDEGNPEVPYYDGTTVDGSYMSSDWTGPLLPFTGGKRYEFHHGLGCTPYEIACWVSFSPDGVKNGSIAQSSGNLCVVQEVNDKVILVKNDTCSDMYVMVTASASCGSGSDAGLSDAGGDGD